MLGEQLRTYSSGMVARLAFAVASDSEPEVLLLDEVFAVGDAAFQRRSLERVQELVSHGSTAVVISHDLETLKQHCSRALWMSDGQVIRDGEPGATIDAYWADSQIRS